MYAIGKSVYVFVCLRFKELPRGPAAASKSSGYRNVTNALVTEPSRMHVGTAVCGHGQHVARNSHLRAEYAHVCTFVLVLVRIVFLSSLSLLMLSLCGPYGPC